MDESSLGALISLIIVFVAFVSVGSAVLWHERRKSNAHWLRNRLRELHRKRPILVLNVRHFEKAIGTFGQKTGAEILGYLRGSPLSWSEMDSQFSLKLSGAFYAWGKEWVQNWRGFINYSPRYPREWDMLASVGNLTPEHDLEEAFKREIVTWEKKRALAQRELDELDREIERLEVKAGCRSVVQTKASALPPATKREELQKLRVRVAELEEEVLAEQGGEGPLRRPAGIPRDN